MHVRAAPTPPDYQALACERRVGPWSVLLRVAGRDLPTRTANSRRIAALGHTGCRMENLSHFQACDDLVRCPLEQTARSVARWRPD